MVVGQAGIMARPEVRRGYLGERQTSLFKGCWRGFLNKKGDSNLVCNRSQFIPLRTIWSTYPKLPIPTLGGYLFISYVYSKTWRANWHSPPRSMPCNSTTATTWIDSLLVKRIVRLPVQWWRQRRQAEGITFEMSSTRRGKDGVED